MEVAVTPTAVAPPLPPAGAALPTPPPEEPAGADEPADADEPVDPEGPAPAEPEVAPSRPAPAARDPEAAAPAEPPEPEGPLAAPPPPGLRPPDPEAPLGPEPDWSTAEAASLRSWGLTRAPQAEARRVRQATRTVSRPRRLPGSRFTTHPPRWRGRFRTQNLAPMADSTPSLPVLPLRRTSLRPLSRSM